MSTPDVFENDPAPETPKKSGGRVFLIIGTVIGIGLVVCCGIPVIGYFAFKDTIMKSINSAFSMTTDPVEVITRSEEVLEIEIPEKLEPNRAMRISPGPFTMKMIIYQAGANEQEGLVIMEMEQPGADPKIMRDQMLAQMRSQQGQGGGFNTQIVVESKETRKFTINGEEVEFDFIKGTQPGNPTVIRQVTGTFKGRKGVVLLIFIVPDSAYDEEAAIKMLNSIRIPGSDVDAAEEDSEGAATDTQAVEKASEMLEPGDSVSEETDAGKPGEEKPGAEKPSAEKPTDEIPKPESPNPPTEAAPEKPE